MRAQTLALVLLTCLAFGCTELIFGPDPSADWSPGPGVEEPYAKLADRINAPAYWNEVARALVAKHASSPFQAVRTYAILSVAQYNGAVTGGPRRRESRGFVRAAITRASVDVLAYVYPMEAAALEAKADSFLTVSRGAAGSARDRQEGSAAGARAAAAMIERARTDRWLVPWDGTPPVGPGIWFSSAVPPAPPSFPLLGQAKTFLLNAGDQFRPPPPPAFGSPAFDAAVAEVRRVAEARTPAQDSLARFWALPAGTYTPFGYWNEEAVRLALRNRYADIETAHLLALMNMVGADAVIASHDAKYTYWLLRPSQADPGIRLAIGLPNFPAYVSNHASLSGGMARTIGRWFPAERQRLEGLAEEAAMSRLFGGIHYRFDNEIGLELGRQVARWAAQRDVRTGEPYVLR